MQVALVAIRSMAAFSRKEGDYAQKGDEVQSS